MGNFKKHIDITKEKLEAILAAYKMRQNTVVGDLATKVIEQLVEADASKEMKHFGDHLSRHHFANQNYPKEINYSMRKIWFAYGDLGYDGVNGKRAKIVMKNLKKVVEFFENKFGINLWQE